MKWCRFCLLVAALTMAVDSARAGIFFNRKPKPQTADRVPTLLYTLKTDASEQKRVEAADELRNYDAGTNPEIIPVLIESALKDPQASVRSSAVQTLGKLRPVSQLAGKAIEQAASSDPSMRVQLQARSTLLQYRMSGYHSSKTDPAPAVPTRTIRTEEPPLAPLEPTPPPAVRQQAQPAPLPVGPTLAPSSAPRPMPSSATPVQPMPSSSAAPVQPIPSSSAAPAQPIVTSVATVPLAVPLAVPVAAPPVEDGPDLSPPN